MEVFTMLKLRMSWFGLLMAMAGVCATSAVAQTAPPALPPVASGTYATNSSSGSANQTVRLYTVQTKNAPSGRVSITYDAPSDSYHLSNTYAGFIEGPIRTINLPADTVDYLNGQIGQGNYRVFSAFRNTAGAYSYTRYALTSSFDNGTGSRPTYSSEAYVFGTPATAVSIPKVGAAYYVGLVDGWAGSNRLVNGTGNLLINFTSGEVATGFNLSTASGFLGRYDGRGLVTAGSSIFTGSLFGSGNTSFVGAFNGGFYGPAAQEVGLTFALASSTSTITGAFIGTSATPPTAPATPPVAPVVPINTSLVGPLQSDTFTAIGGEVQANLINASTTASQSAVARTEAPGAIRIAYDAAANSYSISDTYGSAVFGAPAVPAANGTTTTRTFAAGTSNAQSLILSVPGSANPRLELTYLSYGIWQPNRDTIPTSVINRSFFFGVETPAADLPRSGGALYNGVIAGTWMSGASTYRLDDRSDGSVLANFYTGEVRTTMSLVGTEINQGTIRELGRVDGYGSIAGGTSHFTGTMTGTNNDYSGNFQGAFHGPAHQEAGVSFALAGANGAGAVNGVIVAKQVPIH